MCQNKFILFVSYYCLNSKAINILIIHENEAKKN